MKVQQYASALSDLIISTNRKKIVHKPIFYRLKNEEERNGWDNLLQTPGLKVSDELHGQIRELIKAKNPTKKFLLDELDQAATKYHKDVLSEEYGVWVYYPWLNHVVHILDKEEYREIRTNRNQYKITPEERDILGKLKVGVLGLSVGQAVAITLAMERCFGELRIADFDTLELSNLNRIRSGVQDLGLLKTVSTARQIAEIDPFLNVNCFHEGLTEENLDAFFLVRGKLDILIDECDGLDVKILARHKAKELGVPVLMETSDRGMMDVERFDLEPERSILHGLIDHLDHNPENLKGLSNEEKIPYILPMLGLDTMSDRLKASMLEVEQSVTTWPQLASDVILGGAVCTNVCRRIALNQFQTSGRFFVDMNDIVSAENMHHFLDSEADEEENQYRESSELEVPEQSTEAQQLELTEAKVKALVEAAIWAPTGGNSQPWRWIYQNKNLYLLLDESRATAFLDFEKAGAYLGLGAATENLILKAHEMGLEVNVETFPEKGNKLLVTVFRMFKGGSFTKAKLEGHQHDDLHDAITYRLTNRLLSDRQKINSNELAKIREIGQTIPGAKVLLIDEVKTMEAIGKLIARIDRIMITSKEGHQGFVSEIRWSDEEAARKKDGVDIATIDLTVGEAAGFRMAKNWSVVNTLNKWGGGSVFEKLSKKCIDGASAIGLITMPGSESQFYYKAGRTLERIWLFANKNKIALQPMTALPFMLHRLIHGNGIGLTESNVKQLQEIKEEFYDVFNLDPKMHPTFLFRLLVANDPVVKSQRRPVEQVLIYKGNAE